ncbi:hypothetical protein SK128_012051 [Halocaridina rubra]|uniref:Peptidase S1 domain-containing protein n=1 Tax=Halocaridina rubra TaxID=373956 RepID=A0AAN8WPW1_HALRR
MGIKTVAFPGCGRMNRAGRIVGGSQVTPNQYPWQVAILEGDKQHPFCGGSIISDSWILTAAHCLVGRRLEDLRIIVGEHDWTTRNETNITKILRAKHMTRHYGFFMRMPLDNDIGLIQLAVPLVFPPDNSIAPVCLPPPNRLYSDVDALVLGWGTTENKFSGLSKFLRATEVNTMTNDVCQAIVMLKGPITENMICAGFLFGGENACHGDSGGPLLTQGDGCGGNCLVQIGVVSWGSMCNLGVLPTVYTRTNRKSYSAKTLAL